MKGAADLNRKRQTANCITISRMIGTVLLLAARPLSPLFYGLYTCTGLTDVLDGAIARATKSTSDLGSKLDSTADLLFYGVTFFVLFPTLRKRLPVLIWYVAVVILVLRLTAYLTAAVKCGRFTALHTLWNKLTGVTVFVIPYLIGTRWLTPACYAAASLAAFAVVDELVRHCGAEQ